MTDMRRHTLSLIAAALLVLPPAAAAQQGAGAAPPSTPVEAAPSNMFDVGFRGTFFDAGSDEARLQRYRDLRNGPTVDLFNWGKETDTHGFTVHAEHIGYRDQQYSATYDNYGRLKVAVEWNQTPLFFSQRTATLFGDAGPGVLRIDDAIQSGIENKTTTLGAAVAQANGFDLRQQRDVLSLALTYSATRNLDLNVSVKNTMKNGQQPWAGTFGFSDAVELAAPIDTRTTEVGTSLEWSNQHGLVHVGYDGSFFRNNISSLVWDNPLRITDSSAGPFQGRMTLWPNSDVNAANVSGLLKLPRDSQATAYVSLGNWTQDDPLIPFTINSALPVIPLDRATAGAKAVVTAMNYGFTSRPVDRLWFNARFRSYDFDNRTPVFHVSQTVAYDTSVAAFAEGGTSPYSFTRRTVDADASYNVLRFTALRFGFTREQVDQTFRSFDTTAENTFRVSADSTGLSWLTVRGVYEHAKRVGSGLDAQTLDDIGEQVSLRQFDISDRTSNRFSAIALVTPVSSIGINGSVSAGNEDRPGAAFGLRSNDNRGYSIGADFVPSKAVSAGVSDRVREVHDDAGLETSQSGTSVRRPDARLDDRCGRRRAHGQCEPRFDQAATQDRPEDWLRLQPRPVHVHLQPRAELIAAARRAAPAGRQPAAARHGRLALLRHAPAGRRLRVPGRQSTSVSDFAHSADTLNSLALPSFLSLGYVFEPYTAHTITARLSYYW